MTLSRVEPLPGSELNEVVLKGSYHRLGEVFGKLRIRCTPPPPTGRGWYRAADLARNPSAVRELIAFDAIRSRLEYGVELRPDVAAGLCLHRYTWPVALAFTLPWFLERRVPRLPADRVAIHPSSGELTVFPAEFACLPDDPAARLPTARVVPDEAALRAVLLASVTEHLAPLLPAFRPAVRRGPHTLWGLSTDDLVEGLWYVGGLLGQEERAAAELSRLLPPGGARPFIGGAAFRGQDGLCTRTRVSCCLFYTAHPEEACLGCPRR